MRGIRPGAAHQRRSVAILFLAALCLAPGPAALAHPGIHERIAAVGREIHERPRDATLYLRRGELRRLHGEFAAAEADYGRARRLDPGLATVDLCLGSLRDDQKRFAEAVAAFDRYLAARPGDAAGHAARARVLAKLGRHPEAAAGMTRAIDAASQPGQIPSPDWYDERAIELLAAGNGRSQEALAGLDEGIERLGGPVSLQLRAVELEESLGRFDAALARLERLAAASGEGAASELEPRRAGILERAGRTGDARSPGAPAPGRGAAAQGGRGATPAIGAFEAAAQEAVFVQSGSAIRYRANASDPGIGLAWTDEEFDDSGWADGLHGIGYETALPGAQGLLRTTVPAGTYSVYTRARFTVADASQVTSLFLGVDYDDGYVAWLNGVEVFRSPQMPAGAPAWNTNAASHESSNGASPTYLPLQNIAAAGLPALHDGVNVLAVGIWNFNAPSSTDLVLVPKLSGNKEPSLTRGPYLQRGTASSVVVRWRTDVATDSVVRYGASPAGLTSSVSDFVPTTEHVVTLSGLDPATRHFYSVGSSAATLAGGDPDHAFTTSPPPGTAGPWRVWVVGDSGTADALARAVRDAYDAFAGPVPTDLWLMLGDNAYPDGTDAQYQSAVFDMYPRLLAKSVLWPTYGNHDGHSADSASQTGPYYDIFTLPAAAQAGGAVSGTEAYYSFDFGNIHFICLDSYETSRAAGSPMMTWLALDLLGTTKDWIIAFWHHPPYTKGSHDSDSEVELIEMRQNALPILEAGGADLVLCGHSHSYERSYLLDGHYGLSTTFSDAHKKDGGDGRSDGTGAYHKATPGPSAHQGSVYAVAGSSGQISGGTLDHPAMYLSLNVLGSLVLDVRGNRLDAAFLDSGGAIRDHFTITKGPDTAPVPEFLASPLSGAAPLTVSFYDRSTNSPAAWSWDFDGDGTGDSAAAEPSHTYAVPGLYSVRLTASNAAGSGSRLRAGYVCATAGSAPPAVTGLRLAVDKQALIWDAQGPGTTYDVVKGDLGSLAGTGGDFSASLLGCLAPRAPSPSASDAATPGPGIGFFYLVRAIDCAPSAGTFDSGAQSQSGSRDAEIAASPSRCP